MATGGGQRWKVCAEEGTPVRNAREASAQELPERLPKGAIISEVELAGDALRYLRVSSEGPQSGWVSIKSLEKFVPTKRKVVEPAPLQHSLVPKAAKADEEQAISDNRWAVVVEEGLVVRKGQRQTSQKIPERLPVGVVVEEVEMVGDRLRFMNLTGLGPPSGWVSVADKGMELMQRVCDYSDPTTSFEGMKRGFLNDAKVDLYPKGSSPLDGWASLSEFFGEAEAQRAGLPGPAVAAETVGRRRKFREELPPVDELENLDENSLVELLGFDDIAAKEFAGMSRTQKRKMIAEAKALMEMGTEKRLEALENYKKAWPQGPFPELTPSVEDHGVVLPPGSCFPYSRHLRSVPAGLAPEWGLEAPAGRSVRSFFRRRNVSAPEAQKEFLRSLRCEVQNSGGFVSAPSGVAVADPCRSGNLVDREQLSSLIVSKSAAKPEDVCRYFNGELEKRVCLLDGDMGERLVKEKLEENDFRGERFKNFKETDAKGSAIQLKGNNALLVLTKASLIADIHKEFLQAGSDIIRTNTFDCNVLTQKEFKTNKLVYEMNKSAAQLAKKATAEVTKQDTSRPRFVAGVIGPTPCMMSSASGVSWSEMADYYDEQIKGLVEGGVDLLMLDGMTDGLNAKAALYAIDDFFERAKRKKMPVMVSAQVGDGGRTGSGQSAEAFCISVKHGLPLSVGVAASSSSQLKEHYKPMSSLHLGWCSATAAAAGEDPEKFANGMAQLAQQGLLNFVGGGAGVLPAHISALAKQVGKTKGRSLPDKASAMYLQLAGLDACLVKQDDGFQVVGSQCTVMGSAKFKKKVGAYKVTKKEKHLKEALEVCVEQCDKGADILDFNLDSDVASGPACPAKDAMSVFMRMASAEPKVAKVPFMLCSCHWDTIKEGLKCVQGKCIVNGLTLTVGEEEFLRIARECKQMGAALVVLATTDDSEPAESQNDKVKICQQSYKLLRSKLDFPAEDIIFDCHVLLLGLPEYASRISNFIGAVAELKRTCPGASFVAGVNNLSLPYRGLNMLRDALHSVFLYHAIPKGLNLAITWPGALPLYSDIDAETRALCEEMVLNRSADGNHLERFNAFVKFRANSLACLPMQQMGPLRRMEDEQGNWVKVAAVRKEAKDTQKALVARRRVATPAQQKAFLQSLHCDISCGAGPVRADVATPDACRLEGAANRDGLSNTIVAKGTARRDDAAKYLNGELRKRALLLASPERGGGEADYRAYFEAGCDICGTGVLQGGAYEACKAAAQSAKSAAAEATKKGSQKPRLVAGALGPGEASLCASPGSTWDDVVAAYAEQVRGLVDGGVDLLAIEGVSDTLNAKAAICAVEAYFKQTKKEQLPLIITAAISGSGRLACGQSIEAFYISIKHAKPFSVGVSGSNVKDAAQALARVSMAWCHVSGDSAEACVSDKLANLAGATSPSQASAMAGKVSSASPRPLPALPSSPKLQLSGLEAFAPGGSCTLVGQRCNMSGSKAFKGYVDAYKYAKESSSWESARELCAAQCGAGAEILDFNFDSELTDAQTMGKFMRLCATDAKVATAPFLLSSTKWSSIEEGLKSVQGKSIVNAITLAEGEEEFLYMAEACRRFGAAVVVMTLDTPGEVPSFSGKVQVGQKAYRLLRSKLDFPAEDIIFDCNIGPMGPQESMKDLIEAIAELKRTCPSVSFIGGVSNLSLPFRDAPPLRDAMHSIFLYHAIPMGLNFIIADVGSLPRHDDIEAETRRACEEAIMRDPSDSGAVDRLESYAAYLTGAVAEEIPTALVAAYDMPSAIPLRVRNSDKFTQAIHTLVQGTGTINASVFQTFGSKCHTATLFHKDMAGLAVKRSVWFSSISAWMGQGGSGPITGCSALMDGIALHERWQGLGNVGVSVEWGAIGEIGLRRTVYGSRDVFAQFDLGQKLIGPADTQRLMRAVCVGQPDPYEVVGMAYLDQTWQMTLAGATTGSAIERKNFADM